MKNTKKKNGAAAKAYISLFKICHIQLFGQFITHGEDCCHHAADGNYQWSIVKYLLSLSGMKYSDASSCISVSSVCF